MAAEEVARYLRGEPPSIPAEEQELTMNKNERELRQAIIDACRWMNASGLNQGTSGNISARYGDTMLITPTASPYDELTPDIIASMPSRASMASGRGRWTRPRSGASISTSCGRAPRSAPSSTPTRPMPPRSRSRARRSRPATT